MSVLLNEHQQWLDNGVPIVNGLVFVGTNGNDPTVGYPDAPTNLITIYSDRALTTPITNPQATDADGRTVNKVWLPDVTYSVVVRDSDGVQKYISLDEGVKADELPIANVAELITTPGSYDGQHANLAGYYTVGDGGGGKLYWDATSTETPDNGMIFGAWTTGRWKRPDKGAVSFRYFGAKLDNSTDDSTIVNAAILVWSDFIIDSGTMYIASPILLKSSLRIRGFNKAGIRTSGTITAFLGSGSTFLEQITIDGLIIVNGTYAIDMGQAHKVRITNLDIRDMTVCSISHVVGEQNFYENITIRNNNTSSSYALALADETVSTLSITVDPIRGAWVDRSRFINFHIESQIAGKKISTAVNTGNDINSCTLKNFSIMAISNYGLVARKVHYCDLSEFVFDGCGIERTDTLNKMVSFNALLSSNIELFQVLTNCVHKYGVHVGNVGAYSKISHASSSGDNVANYGFYVENSTGYLLALDSCTGALYVNNPNQYKIDQLDLFNCHFSTNNLGVSHSLSNYIDQNIDISISNDNLASSTASGRFRMKVGRAGASQEIFSAGDSGVYLGDCAWNFRPLRLGGYYLWIDATGDMRIKLGAPVSDTDGAVVGTQT